MNILFTLLIVQCVQKCRSPLPKKCQKPRNPYNHRHHFYFYWLFQKSETNPKISLPSHFSKIWRLAQEGNDTFERTVDSRFVTLSTTNSKKAMLNSVHFFSFMNSIFHEFNKILFTENRFFILSYRLLRNFPPSSKHLHNSHNLKIYAEALSYDRGSFYQWSIRNIINSVVINWPESLQFSSENILYVILIVMQKRQKYAITYVYVDYDWFGTVKLETYFDFFGIVDSSLNQPWNNLAKSALYRHPWNTRNSRSKTTNLNSRHGNYSRPSILFLSTQLFLFDCNAAIRLIYWCRILGCRNHASDILRFCGCICRCFGSSLLPSPSERVWRCRMEGRKNVKTNDVKKVTNMRDGEFGRVTDPRVFLQ